MSTPASKMLNMQMLIRTVFNPKGTLSPKQVVNTEQQNSPKMNESNINIMVAIWGANLCIAITSKLQ